MIMDIIMNRLNIDKYRRNWNPILKVYFSYLNHKLLKSAQKLVETNNMHELIMDYVTVLGGLTNIGFITTDISHNNIDNLWGYLRFKEGNISIVVETDYASKRVHIIRIERVNGRDISNFFTLGELSGYNTEMDKLKLSTEIMIRQHIANNLSFILKELKV